MKWWLADRWQRRVLVTAVLLVAPHSGGAGSGAVVTPRQAIERAAVERLGSGVVRVDVDALATSVDDAAALVAVPDPAGYVGRTTRFSLTVDGKRRGIAVAAVRVRARLIKVVKPIERDALIESDAVAMVEEEVQGVRFSRLPEIDEVVGSRARRDMPPGVIVTAGMVAAPPAVMNGDRVTVGVTIGRVHVTGEGIASGSGQVGDVVRVMQPGRKTMLKARVVERGVVEVMP